jgi:hypothetical protein
MKLTLEPPSFQKPLLSQLPIGTVFRRVRRYGSADFMIMAPNSLTKNSVSEGSVVVLRLSGMFLEGIADERDYENLGTLTYKA